MPILEINILGSKISINYQENEKEKLISLVKKFNARLSEFENIKGKFADNKIILLAALKIEDDVNELSKKIIKQNEIIESSSFQKKQIDYKIKEIINLKDQISLLKENNQKLKETNDFNINEFEKINKKIMVLINKIIAMNNHED